MEERSLGRFWVIIIFPDSIESRNHLWSLRHVVGLLWVLPAPRMISTLDGTGELFHQDANCKSQRLSFQVSKSELRSNEVEGVGNVI